MEADRPKNVSTLSPAPLPEKERGLRAEPTPTHDATAADARGSEADEKASAAGAKASAAGAKASATVARGSEAGGKGSLGLLRRADRTGLPLLSIRIILGLMFVYMGANKLADPIVFMKGIRQYQMLPETPGIFLNLSAVALPWMEVFAGVALLLGVHIRGAALALIIMLAVFTPAVYLRALEVQRETLQSFFDLKFDCGCGTGEEVIWSKLLMNVGLFLLAVGALFSQSRRFCLSMFFERRGAPTRFCHFCGYAVKRSQAGLCASCATPPTIP